MNTFTDQSKRRPNRRAFIRNGLAIAGVAAGGSALLADSTSTQSGPLSTGDIAMLRFHTALEILETDFWEQYNELAGVQDSEVPGGSGNPAYAAALASLDDDMAQYIHDNTDDERTHAAFLNGYLASKGAPTVSLESFRNLPGSTATGSSGRARLTNLMQLTMDTSWYTRYRATNQNPDLNPNFVFPQAIPDLANGEFTAIPRTDADLTPADHLQAIAYTAAWHFPTVEQGGSSLYPQHALRATNVDALRILISIGPTETTHFQTWHDLAGDATGVTDPTNGLNFPDLNSPPFGGDLFSTNLIMPEPCPFLSVSLPKCSIIRPTNTQQAASNALAFLTAMGLFRGQSSGFFELMGQLAAQADAARRGM